MEPKRILTAEKVHVTRLLDPFQALAQMCAGLRFPAAAYVRAMCSIAHLLVEVEELLLGGDIRVVEVVAAHLVLVLEQHLPVCQRGRVPDVLEVRHALHAHISLARCPTESECFWSGVDVVLAKAAYSMTVCFPMLPGAPLMVGSHGLRTSVMHTASCMTEVQYFL